MRRPWEVSRLLASGAAGGARDRITLALWSCGALWGGGCLGLLSCIGRQKEGGRVMLDCGVSGHGDENKGSALCVPDGNKGEAVSKSPLDMVIFCCEEPAPIAVEPEPEGC